MKKKSPQSGRREISNTEFVWSQDQCIVGKSDSEKEGPVEISNPIFHLQVGKLRPGTPGWADLPMVIQ